MFWMALLPALASVAGAGITAAANTSAANTAVAAQERAMQVQLEAIDKYIDALDRGLDVQTAAHYSGYETAIKELEAGYGRQLSALEIGNAGAQDAYRAIQFENAPGMSYLRQVVADPESLTPEQRYELERTRDVVGQNIRASGFAGSGRTAAALMRDVEAGVRNSMLASNRATAMQAAGVMADNYGQAGANIANLKEKLGVQKAETERDTSFRVTDEHNRYSSGLRGVYGDYYDRLGNAYLSAGRTQADAATNSGNIRANATTATGSAFGQAIGDIGSAIANANRESRYAERLRYG